MNRHVFINKYHNQHLCCAVLSSLVKLRPHLHFLRPGFNLCSPPWSTLEEETQSEWTSVQHEPERLFGRKQLCSVWTDSETGWNSVRPPESVCIVSLHPPRRLSFWSSFVGVFVCQQDYRQTTGSKLGGRVQHGPKKNPLKFGVDPNYGVYAGVIFHFR